MYVFEKNTKRITFALMAIGAITIMLGFLSGTGHDEASHHALQRVWANILTSNFFFLAIALAGTFFVAVNYVAQAGWGIGLKRIPEAMGSFLPFAGVVMLILILAGALHWNHLYHWMDTSLTDPQSEVYDEIIAGKAAYLNIPFFIIRTLVYLGVWIGCTCLLRKWSLQEDISGGLEFYKKSFTLSAVFIVFFAVTSSTSAWDWLMSIDTHWYSTLFGWYTFSGLFVSGLTVIALITIHLKNKGLLPHIQESHLHDLGKFMFAFSIFWTYLWFSQFMLIWYANIPEEVTYFVERMQEYKLLFLGMLLVNFVFPFLVLMSRDYKRKTTVLTLVGIVLIVGHWIDVFVMVMPGTVHEHWHIGWIEIGTFLGFLGAFTFVVLKTLSKAPLVVKNHPYLQESLHHHI